MERPHLAAAARGWVCERLGMAGFTSAILRLWANLQIPREVRIADSNDLRGWTATYGETVPKAVQPFMHGPAVNGPAAAGAPDLDC